MSSNLRKERHSVSDLKIHLVCVTKYRRKVFTVESLALIEQFFGEIASKMNFNVLEFKAESDHIHVLIEYPPKLSISLIVNTLKGVSRRKYGQAGFPKPYGKNSLWSPSPVCFFCQRCNLRGIEVLHQKPRKAVLKGLH